MINLCNFKSTSFQVTPFQVADAGQLAELIDSVCADTLWMQTTRFEPTPAWQYALENEHCAHHLLALARVEHQVIGWCRLFPAASFQPGSVELGIGVLKPYRHQGVGTSMMAYAIAWTKTRSLSEIILTTQVQNVPAIGLFEKFGFWESGREGELLRMGLDVGGLVGPALEIHIGRENVT